MMCQTCLKLLDMQVAVQAAYFSAISCWLCSRLVQTCHPAVSELCEVAGCKLQHSKHGRVSEAAPVTLVAVLSHIPQNVGQLVGNAQGQSSPVHLLQGPLRHAGISFWLTSYRAELKVHGLCTNMY